MPSAMSSTSETHNNETKTRKPKAEDGVPFFARIAGSDGLRVRSGLRAGIERSHKGK